MDVLDRRDVAGILDDPRCIVPEADAAAAGPFGRFRARASRFANGALHDRRREGIEHMLGALDPGELAVDAASRTRALLRETDAEVDVARVACTVPVACLADRLGFDRPDDLPRLVAEVAPAYASGTGTAAADTSVARLLAAAPRGGGAVAAHEDDGTPELAVQLLVQAYAATAGLIEGGMRAAGTATADTPTRDLLATVLRDDPPVGSTRRVAPDGSVLALHFDGPDSEARAGHPPRTLAFGAGPRACPAQDLALAIADAVIEELRAC
jgi:hypothetical protein